MTVDSTNFLPPDSPPPHSGAQCLYHKPQQPATTTPYQLTIPHTAPQTRPQLPTYNSVQSPKYDSVDSLKIVETKILKTILII